MKCKLCETRKARRYCPGVQGDICSICCGNEREVTIACPLDCPYLRESRAREKRVQLQRESLPNPDIEVSEQFLRQHQELTSFVGVAISRAASFSKDAVDSDIRDALDALTRTYRAISNGLYYEGLPNNLIAARIYKKIQELLSEYREARQKEGAQSIRDAEILGVMVMYQWMALTFDNGRPKSRWFIDDLVTKMPPVEAEPERESGLIEL